MTPIDPRRQIVPVVALTPEEIVEDLTDLARFGVGMVEAAHRVGKSVAACEMWLYRHDRPDLVRALWALNARGRTEPLRERRSTLREHYGRVHGAWAAQVRADAEAMVAAAEPDDSELIAQRRRALVEAAWSA